jgi:hypothetical protein
VAHALRKLGLVIRDARRRSLITAASRAERASSSRVTLGREEHGDPGVSIGIYAKVLFSLGLELSLADLADPRHDALGLQLEEERLPQRVRYPGRKKRTQKED